MISSEHISTLQIQDDAKALLFTLLHENLELRQKLEESEDRLLSTNEAMQLLGCGRNKFWKLSKLEGFPKAIQFGKANHYKQTELRAFRSQYINELSN
ncbi:helix-turn-helix transcriptional regulator [Pseudoalteromonas sp. S16_S37]|uniref:helix-turn-helix transcriptional regulator n=1 Tax=Pseudoalteromonas sp. S16_S37 TaxID=2720228 RepID=UPI00168106FE|nr:hypothetical protein [Pseudoalteromonas sp. S16_S37]MBD1582778.1 hypothetical protein [Pseudoalteromonas sp. S16_S37]